MTTSFSEALRSAINQYHESGGYDPSAQSHRDPFIQWFKDLQEPRLHIRILLILVNARFDQGTAAERALENTKSVHNAGLLERQAVTFDEIPVLKTRQRVKPETWRRLFYFSLPKLQALAKDIASKRDWKAGEILNSITGRKVPYFGPKTARLAVRWIHELVSELRVDMTDSEVPIDRLVYRISSRMGLIDPYLERYTGPESAGHRKIQEAAKHLFPANPSLLDEPFWLMARRRTNGGFCYPTDPACNDGCMFADFCPKLFRDFDPVVIGYTSAGSAKADARENNRTFSDRPRKPAIARKDWTTQQEVNAPPSTPIPGLLVIISCVKNKIWDVKQDVSEWVRADCAYVGAYFSKNRTYGQLFGEQWCVLSARFGFVLPSDLVSNYDATFKLRSPDLVEPDVLRRQIAEKGLHRFSAIQVLGGNEYVQQAARAFRHFGLNVDAPLSGHRIGEAMQAVQRAIDLGQPFNVGNLVADRNDRKAAGDKPAASISD